MTETIYVVQAGEYSDRRVVALFSDKKRAETYQRYIDPDNDIEEYELDSEEEPDWFKNGYKAYYCWSDRSNEVKCEELNGSDLNRRDEEENVRKAIWTNLPGFDRLCVYCKAKSEEQAIKIAADKFVQYRYEQLHL